MGTREYLFRATGTGKYLAYKSKEQSLSPAFDGDSLGESSFYRKSLCVDVA